MIENPAFSFCLSFSTRSCAASSLLAVFSLSLFVFLASQTLFYLIYVPREKLSSSRRAASALFIAEILSVLRLPFALLPYAAKLFCYLALRKNFKPLWNSSAFQAARLAGDFLNLGISFWFWTALLPIPLLAVPAFAESVRLISEKGFIVFSVIWQRLPLEKCAALIRRIGIESAWLEYYSLSNDDKLETLRRSALSQVELDRRFRYFSRFKIIPDSEYLRSGNVRGIARGEVFIHASWLNDPWLCLGMRARRSTWIFDPRYAPRPFYYRSLANRLMTGFALEHADLFPPFAVYQFGHEIKSARFGIFFKLTRAFGLELERYAQKNGAYQFDPLLAHIGFLLGFESRMENVPLYDDYAVTLEIGARDQLPSAARIAEEYSYPLVYVEEVLLRKIESAREKIRDNPR